MEYRKALSTEDSHITCSSQAFILVQLQTPKFRGGNKKGSLTAVSHIGNISK